MAEQRSNDIIYPPREEFLPRECRNCLIVSYDLETTGLSSDDEIVQIGAYAYSPTSRQSSDFSQYILPATRPIHNEASAKIGLEIRTGRLHDTRTNTILPTVSESEGLQLFLNWVTFLQNGYDGVVLISHGAIFLDIPVLIQALQRTCMTQQFFQVVKGFCDSNAIFQEDRTNHYEFLSLQYLYQKIVGTRREVHRADGDARDLYNLLRRHFNVESLSLSIPMLERYTYTPNCMAQYVIWKRHLDEKMNNLRIIVQDWRHQSEKKKNIILKNLIAAGYDLQILRDEYMISGSDHLFKTQLTGRIQGMKNKYESYLSDTGGVHINEIAKTVVRYFKDKRKRHY